MNKLQFVYHLAKNMGWEYVLYRSKYEFLKKSGLLKRKFPSSYRHENFNITLEAWRKLEAGFFFNDKWSIQFPKTPYPELKKYFDDFNQGKFQFFDGEVLFIGKNYDWLTHPKTGYRYDISKHWSELNEFSLETGDIKYVWEKSRFSYLYSLIRFDYHFEQDLSKLIFSEIESWLKANPLNYGPNYICSQEISLRILNWTFALYYYKNSDYLNDRLFSEILLSIYGQAMHVFNNINFSRKTVRNNHAITETLTLYLLGLLFPFFPQADLWREKGKQWFEQEIDYQIYDDGSYLQFSMNYHRVVIQLLTWAILLAQKNNDTLSPIVFEKAEKSLKFLISFMDKQTGWLPNYGSNDGALFFKLNRQHYRDYRPQLNALHYALYGTHLFDELQLQEDVYWYGGDSSVKVNNLQQPKLVRYEAGGFYGMRDPESLTFIRCGKHKDRPAHADNLHLDIWYKSKNILHDSGTFQYNTDPPMLHYFTGTKGHNTIMLGDYDQMLKGPRFIWFYWTQAVTAHLFEDEKQYVFEGRIKAFTYLDKTITHQRTVKKIKNKPLWYIRDTVYHHTGLPIIQLWHVFQTYKKSLKIEATDEFGNVLKPIITQGWASSLYGLKEPTILILFKTEQKIINTKIEIME